MKVIATLPKKIKPEYDVSGLEPKRPTPAEATLVFLNEIEKNTVKAAEAPAMLASMTETLTKAIESQTGRLLPQPYPVAQPVDLTPVVNATLAVANQVLQSTNKSDTVLLRQLDSLMELHRAIIAQLEKLNSPKEWKFEIDRNFQTGRIQGVTAKIVED